MLKFEGVIITKQFLKVEGVLYDLTRYLKLC